MGNANPQLAEFVRKSAAALDVLKVRAMGIPDAALVPREADQPIVKAPEIAEAKEESKKETNADSEVSIITEKKWLTR